MNRIKLLPLGTLLALSAVGAAACWPLASCRKTDDPTRQVPVDESQVQEIEWFHAEAWDDVPNWGRVLFRYVDESREDFVIVPGFSKRIDEVPVEVAYRYGAQEERFQPVGREVWETATGEVWTVREQRDWTGNSGVRRDAPFVTYGTLYGGSTKFETAGWAVLTAVVSPGECLVGAVSAAGPERESLLSTPVPEGPYYVEIFRIEDATRLGPIYRLKKYGRRFPFWWTPDGRYVLSGRIHILVLPVFKFAEPEWPDGSCRKIEDPSPPAQLDESKVQEIDWFHIETVEDVRSPREFFFRYVDKSHEDFVIAPMSRGSDGPIPAGTAYRYNAREKRLDPVGREVWDNASGPIWRVYEGPSWNRRAKVCFDRPFGKYGTLHLGPSKFETAGWAVLAAEASPDGEFVVVASAAGERPPPNTERTPKGPYYLEIFSVEEMQRVSPIYRFEHRGGVIRPWWTRDGRYVLSGRKRVLVLPVYKLVADK